jgi:hypothetical protein
MLAESLDLPASVALKLRNGPLQTRTIVHFGR